MLVPTAVKQKACFYRMKAKQSQLCCEGTALMAAPPSANVWEKLKYRIRSPETWRESELMRYSNIINVRDNHVLTAPLKPPPSFSIRVPLQLFRLSWKMFGAGTLKKHFCVIKLWEELRAGQEPCKHLSSSITPQHTIIWDPPAWCAWFQSPWTMAFGRTSVNALWISPYIWSKKT